MVWFKRSKKPKPVVAVRPRSQVPEGLWVKCDGCREIIYSKELHKNLMICPKSGYHFRISAPERIGLLIDEEQPRELFTGILPVDPLKFRDTKPYKLRLKQYQDKTGIPEAVRVVEGRIEDLPVILAVMEYRFMGGSMGSVVGEKITRAAEEALRRDVGLLVVSASGGARMPDGFQRSEFLLQHGFLDMVVPRTELKQTVARCLRHFH